MVANVGYSEDSWSLAMEASAPLLIVSADSHVTEPADLWCHRLDRNFRDKAPRVVRDYRNDRYLFVAPGISPFPIATGFGAGKEGRELKQHLNRGYEAARAGGWDPVERLRDQDADGIACEVLYPTHGMKLFALSDAELQRACFRVYNDWIVEFAVAAPTRLVPLALISLYEIPESVRELERAARMGVAGVLVWGAPPETQPSYGSRFYDPFWQAAESLGLPVSLHCITSAQPRVRSKSAYVQYLDVIHDVQHSLSEIVCGGVLERFPKLIIVSAENDCGWIPHFLFRLDHAHEKFGRFAKPPLPMRPSEYVRRQVYATFQEDSTVAQLCDNCGADRYMWASDYPHVDSTWPQSRTIIAQTLGELPDAVVMKLTGGNAARLYLS
jgi:predicted TIM-barrel fold metal-dependent hydrolase